MRVIKVGVLGEKKFFKLISGWLWTCIIEMDDVAKWSSIKVMAGMDDVSSLIKCCALYLCNLIIGVYLFNKILLIQISDPRGFLLHIWMSNQ